MKERYRVDLSYDGTEFHGSQYQPDLRTVQGEVESSLRQLTWQGDSVLFAGRTDAGVHAAGQVIAFDLDWGHEEKDLQRALNAVFPEDIAARKVDRVEEDFHPRYHAKARHYRYQIHCSPVRHPLVERYSWRLWPEMNLQKLNQAAGPLVGTHDFRAFGSPHQPEGSTIREIRQANWQENADLLVFDLVGNAFLYHMVRHIVITLVEIGQGKEPIRKIEEYLSDPEGPPAPGLAPARGLILQEVIYESQA